MISPDKKQTEQPERVSSYQMNWVTDIKQLFYLQLFFFRMFPRVVSALKHKLLSTFYKWISNPNRVQMSSSQRIWLNAHWCVCMRVFTEWDKLTGFRLILAYRRTFSQLISCFWFICLVPFPPSFTPEHSVSLTLKLWLKNWRNVLQRVRKRQKQFVFYLPDA